MAEIIVLVFKDGTRYNLNTGNMMSLLKSMRLRDRKGDPIEVIGEGKAAEMLRRDYRIYNADPKNYKMDVVGGISEQLNLSVDDAKAKFNSVKKKLKL